MVEGGGGSGRPVIGPVAVDDVVALGAALAVAVVGAGTAVVATVAAAVIGGGGAGSTFAALAVALASTFADGLAEDLLGGEI